jgi:hypothetical protein
MPVLHRVVAPHSSAIAPSRSCPAAKGSALRVAVSDLARNGRNPEARAQLPYRGCTACKFPDISASLAGISEISGAARKIYKCFYEIYMRYGR